MKRIFRMLLLPLAAATLIAALPLGATQAATKDSSHGKNGVPSFAEIAGELLTRRVDVATYRKHFVEERELYSEGIDVCMRLVVEGDMVWTGKKSSVLARDIDNVRVKYPEASIFSKKECGRSGEAKNTSKRVLEHVWWDHRCRTMANTSANVGFSLVGPALGLSFSLATECSSFKVLLNQSTYTSDTWANTQYNSDSIISYDRDGGSDFSVRPGEAECFDVALWGKFHRMSDGNDDNLRMLRDVCIRYVDMD